MFQLTAARRRLASLDNPAAVSGVVSTHSRPKAAGWRLCRAMIEQWFQLTAARRRLALPALQHDKHNAVSTHSRPKAAGDSRQPLQNTERVSTHSRPKAAGYDLGRKYIYRQFQLTAARRRLAGQYRQHQCAAPRFNSQPPEGGWCWNCWQMG